MKRLVASMLALMLMLALAAPAFARPINGNGPAIDSFKPVGTFLVPGGGIAEIVSATPDGQTLIYTNAGAGELGIVDISDPANPTQTMAIPVGGEPTSVAVTADGTLAVAVVKTSTLEVGEQPVITPGALILIELPSGAVLGQRAIGNGPDSVALTEVNSALTAIVVIENEPIVVDDDGNQTDDEVPGLPGDISGPGFVQIVTIDNGNVAASSVQDVTFDADTLAQRGLFFADDPQPEFVDIREGRVAVSLQENNGIAIIDLAGRQPGAVSSIFSLGTVADRPADLTEDAVISFTDTYPADVAGEPFAGARFPDAIAWSPDGSVIYSADEGEFDLTGGRGWSRWSAGGRFYGDDGGAMESLAVQYGFYPDGRSEAKGIEVEGVEIGVFGSKQFLFVGSERGSFVAVFELTNARNPRFLQILPTGIEPEGLFAIPSRNLFVASAEASGDISIFEGTQGVWKGGTETPLLHSTGVSEPWSALSGLAAHPTNPNVLYSIPDDALPTEIFQITLNGANGALVRGIANVTGGSQERFDLEGIDNDTSIAANRNPGWWLAAEGNAAFDDADYLPNLLVQVSRNGSVLDEIALPSDIDSPTGGLIRSNGFEGVAVSDDGRYLLAAIQREYADDEANGGALHTRIARYDLQTDAWEFFLYPLDPTEEGFVGLSEITSLGGGEYAVIERDNQLGGAAAVKRVYTFSLDGLTPHDGIVTAGDDLSGKVIQKTLLSDVLDEFTPYEKVEGFTVSANGTAWALLDNDGGELWSKLVNLGSLANLE